VARNNPSSRVTSVPDRQEGPGIVGAPRPLSVHAREWVVDWWGGGGGGFGKLLRFLTLPLEHGFRMASRARNQLYDRGMLPLQRVPIPVLSVGNLTVGGSGKTPFSAWLTSELRKQGEKPALVARGYGEDEMALHRRWNPDCLVLAEEDRAFGAWKAAKKGASVAILDDGFQHRRLGRELDILLVAASTPGRVRLLPRGPFREPLSAARRAGVVVITQKGWSESSLDMEMRLQPHLREPPVKVAFTPAGWTSLDGTPLEPPTGDYLAVCGIGDPEGFERILEDATGRFGELFALPDHHAYAWRDVQEIRARLAGRTLVTTEKDAVKLRAFRRDLPDARVLRLGLEFLDGKERLWRHVRGILGPRSR